MSATRPSQKALRKPEIRTGTQSVRRGVGAGDFCSDTGFMRELRAWKGFRAVNRRMTESEGFDGFLPLQQSPLYAGALEFLGARVQRFDLGCGQALAVERGRLRLVLRGPVWPGEVGGEERRRALRRLARWPGLTVVTPEEEVSGFGLIPLITPMHHAVWALGPDLRAGMARNWRGHLVQAERSGLRVRRGDAGTLERLIREEGVQRQARRYRALPAGFLGALPEGALRIWEWRQAGAMQAAMVFVRHGASASYYMAWGSGVARERSVHHLMLTRAAEGLATEGVRWLDLGSLDSDRAPGLARFKLGTGAALRRLGATMLVLP